MTEEVRKYLALQKRLNARSPLKEGVRVLPVTKTVEPARILPLKDAGAAEIGENRVQEALEKLPLLKGAFGIRIIGRLQTNKARYVARIASAVESLDRIELADALQRALDRENRALDVLIEVNAGNDPAKAGVAPEELKQFLRARVGIRPAARARADDGRADCARPGAGASMLSPDAPPV